MVEGKHYDFNAILEFEINPDIEPESVISEFASICDYLQIQVEYNVRMERIDRSPLPNMTRTFLVFEVACQLRQQRMVLYLSQILHGHAGILTMMQGVYAYSFSLL